MNLAATEAEAPDQRHPVTLTLDAASSQAPVARSVAETLGILYGFGLDEVADIKLAVDEACAQLEQTHGDNPEITMTIEMRRRAMVVSVTAMLPRDASVRQEGFGWHVLRTLTDDAAAVPGDSAHGEDGCPWSITFTKSSSAAR